MKRLGTALLYAIVAYVVAALAGYLLVQQFSSNVHDRDLEAAMTAPFVIGPLGAIVGFVVGLVRGGRSSTPPQA
jgi:uncharacterized membrane protein YfcA